MQQTNLSNVPHNERSQGLAANELKQRKDSQLSQEKDDSRKNLSFKKNVPLFISQ